MPDNNRKILEQGRAKFAFELAEKGVQRYGKEYKQYARKIPTMIKTNGLGTTLAFMYSKRGTYGAILTDIESWLKENEKCKKLIHLNEGEELVKKIIEVKMSNYRALTIEIMAFLNWLRRFSEGLHKD